MILKYRNKSGDKDPKDSFFFNAKKLNEDLNLAEAGLQQNSEIIVVSTKDIKGA